MKPSSERTRFHTNADRKALDRYLRNAVGASGLELIIAISSEFVKSHGYDDQCLAEKRSGNDADDLRVAVFNLIDFANCKGLAIDLTRFLQEKFGTAMSCLCICAICNPVERTVIELEKYFYSFQDLQATLSKYNPPSELVEQIKALSLEKSLDLILRSSESNEDLKRFVDDVANFSA
jgi:hypothetical protein